MSGLGRFIVVAAFAAILGVPLAKGGSAVMPKLESAGDGDQEQKSSALTTGASLSVSVRADATSDGALTASVRYVNTGARPLYAFDRLWTLTSRNEIVEDPALAYSFLADDTLQVLLGLAPLPSRTTVLYRNVPYATKIEPGQTISRRLSWKPPVREYSVYFPEERRTQYSTVRTSRIVVFVDWVMELADLPTIPAPFDPMALKLNRAGIHSLAQRSASPEVALSFTVEKRQDEFDRITPDSRAR